MRHACLSCRGARGGTFWTFLALGGSSADRLDAAAAIAAPPRLLPRFRRRAPARPLPAPSRSSRRIHGRPRVRIEGIPLRRRTLVSVRGRPSTPSPRPSGSPRVPPRRPRTCIVRTDAGGTSRPGPSSRAASSPSHLPIPNRRSIRRAGRSADLASRRLRQRGGGTRDARRAQGDPDHRAPACPRARVRRAPPDGSAAVGAAVSLTSGRRRVRALRPRRTPYEDADDYGRARFALSARTPGSARSASRRSTRALASDVLSLDPPLGTRAPVSRSTRGILRVRASNDEAARRGVSCGSRQDGWPAAARATRTRGEFLFTALRAAATR
jgi:hypothetical protein